MKSKNPSGGLFHWADEVADRLIRTAPQQECFTLASGITPSGRVHIGNFREVITVDLVKRALEKRGKKTRFIFSWDDYDVFRRVPPGLPKAKELAASIGKPIVDVLDPYGEETSYAAYHEKEFATSLKEVGVFPEFICQAEKYRKGSYGEQILWVLKSRDRIKEILDRYRTQPLESDWWPINIYCDQCGYNQVSQIELMDESISYRCDRCENQTTTPVKTAGNLKLLWRIDWPMRWKYEGIHFEPGGKDHSSEGGSFSTAKEIAQEIFNFPAPIYLAYDFVLLKGGKGKMSSSKGDTVTLAELLQIYEPEMVRWLFASYRPNVDFSISFDVDVIRIYEHYDRLERIYYGKEDGSAKKKDRMLRIFELAQLDSSAIPQPMGFQPSFRHLVNIVQIHQFDLDFVVKHYQEWLITEADRRKLILRTKCAIHWIKHYAPEEFIFNLNQSAIEKDVSLLEAYYLAIEDLKKQLNQGLYLKNHQEVSDHIYELVEKHDLELKNFFRLLYRRLIGKDQGPKLGKFLKVIHLDRLNQLL